MTRLVFVPPLVPPPVQNGNRGSVARETNTGLNNYQSFCRGDWSEFWEFFRGTGESGRRKGEGISPQRAQRVAEEMEGGKGGRDEG